MANWGALIHSGDQFVDPTGKSHEIVEVELSNGVMRLKTVDPVPWESNKIVSHGRTISVTIVRQSGREVDIE